MEQQQMIMIRGARVFLGGSVLLAVMVPMLLLWPHDHAQHQAPLPPPTPLPPINLVLTGTALTAPLFNSSRSPSLIASDAQTSSGDHATAPLSPPILVGIIWGHKGGIALAKSTNGDTVQARVGEDIDGWHLLAITPDHAVVEQGGQRVNMAFDFGNRIKISGQSNDIPDLPRPATPPLSLTPRDTPAN